MEKQLYKYCNDLITIQDLQEKALSQFPDNQDIQSRLKQAEIDQNGCIQIIASVQENNFTSEELTAVISLVTDIKNRLVQFTELDILSETENYEQFIHKVAELLNIKKTSALSLEEIQEKIVQKLESTTYKPTKKIISYLSENRPLLQDQVIKFIYQQIPVPEQQQQEEKEQLQEEEEPVQQQQVEKIQQQDEQIEQEQKMEEVETTQIENINNNDIQQQNQETIEEGEIIEQEEQEQQQNQDIQEINENIENQNEMQVEKETQPQQLQQQEQEEKIVEETKTEEVAITEIPSEISEIQYLNQKQINTITELIEQKLKNKRIKKKTKSHYENMIQALNFLTELQTVVFDQNQDKVNFKTLQSYKENSTQYSFHPQLMQILILDDLIESYKTSEKNITTLYNTIYDVPVIPENEPLHLKIFNSKKPELSDIEFQFLNIKTQDLPKFDFSDNEEIMKQLDFIQDQIEITKSCESQILEFQRTINLHKMAQEDIQQVEEVIYQCICQIELSNLQISKFYKEFVYKAWLFSCTCFSKGFKDGSIEEWTQLKECGDFFENKDQRLMQTVEEQIQFAQEVQTFMETLEQQSVESIQNLQQKQEKQYKVIIQKDMLKLSQILTKIQENSQTFYTKMRENNNRLTVKEWRDQLSNLKSDIPFEYEELQTVQLMNDFIDSYNESIKKELKPKILKEKSEQILKDYIKLYFKHPELEKHLKKNKEITQELSSESITNYRQLHYGFFLSYQEFNDFLSKQNEDFINQNQEQILVQKITVLRKFHQQAIIPFTDVKSMYTQISQILIQQQEQQQTQNLKLQQSAVFLEKVIKKTENFLEQARKSEDLSQFETAYKQQISENPINNQFIDMKQEFQQIQQQKEQEKQEREERKRKQREQEENLQQYNPEISNISTKKMSDSTKQFKNIFITRLSKILQDNKNWAMSMDQSISVAKKIVSQIYSYNNNSDKIQSIGERINTFFKLIQQFQKVSQKLYKENFNLNVIMKYKDFNIQQLKCMDNNKTIIQDKNSKQHQTSISPIPQKKIKENLQQYIQQEQEISLAQEKQQEKFATAIEQRYMDVIDNQFTKKSTQKSHNYQQKQQQQHRNNKHSLKKSSVKRTYPQLDSVETSIESAKSLSLENSFSDDQNQPSDIVKICESVIENNENEIQDVQFYSKGKFSQLSSLPVYNSTQQLQSSKNNIICKDSVKLAKFREYFDLMLKQYQNSNKTIMNMGWIESQQYNHNEILRQWGNKLKNSDRVGLIQWANECKFYVMHKDSMTLKWKNEYKWSSDNQEHKVKYENNLVWFCVYKKYKAIPNQKKIIPQFIVKKSTVIKQNTTLKESQELEQLVNYDSCEDNNQINNNFQPKYNQQRYNKFQNNTNHYNNRNFSTKKSVSKGNQNHNNNNNYNFNKFNNYNKRSMSKGQFNNNNNNNTQMQNNFNQKRSIAKLNNNSNMNNNSFTNNTNENYLINKYSTKKQSTYKGNNPNNQSNYKGGNNQYNLKNNNKFSTVKKSVHKFNNKFNNKNQNNNYQYQQLKQQQQQQQQFNNYQNNNNMSLQEDDGNSYLQTKQYNDWLIQQQKNQMGSLFNDIQQIQGFQKRQQQIENYQIQQQQQLQQQQLQQQQQFQQTSIQEDFQKQFQEKDEIIRQLQLQLQQKQMQTQQSQKSVITSNKNKQNLNISEDQQQQQSENMFLRQVQRPVKKSNYLNQQNALGDATNRFQNQNYNQMLNESFDTFNEKENMQNSFSMNTNTANTKRSTYKYSTHKDFNSNNSLNYPNSTIDQRYMQMY